MLVSSTILKNSIANCNKVQKNRENYTDDDDNDGEYNSPFLVNVALVMSIIFFLIELILLFYGINMAIICTDPGPERAVNVSLAVIFTIPYVMFNILFNDCAKKSLKGGWFPTKR